MNAKGAWIKPCVFCVACMDFFRQEGKQDKRNENDAMECIKKTNYVWVNRKARGKKDCQGAKNEMKSIHQSRAIDIDTG